MSETQSDPGLAALVAQVAVGDTTAFSVLYDEVAGLVHGLALRVVRSRALAEEITQDVFVQVWKQAASFDPQRGSVRAWVSVMAHRRAVDTVRRTQSARDREERVPLDPPSQGVEETVIMGDEVRRMRDALTVLTDLQLQAIELAYYGGLTYSEVADRLGTPLGTVKSRMRDGLRRLRATMGGDDE